MGEKIFQVCLSKVNDTGEALYTELDLPARPWALLDALDKVRHQNGDDLSLEIDTYYDCEELEPHLSADQISLMELNDLAVRLSEMSDTQRIAFQGLLRMDEAKGERTISLQRLRNLAASADCCHVVREARSPSQLGRFYAENGFVPEIESLPDSVFELLDFELIGRRAQQGEGGVFTDYGYVVQNSDLNIALDLINKVPQAPKYTVLLELLRGTDNAPDVTPPLLELPLYQRVSMEILKALNSPYQTAYGWRCLDCRVPELAGIIESSSDFAAVEALAAGLSRIDQLDVRLYKAVLSATSCTEISQALELRNQLDQYILDTEIFSPEDQARSELAAMLPEADAQVVASHLNLYAYPPLISQEQFDAVQSRRQKRAAPLRKTPAQKELRRLCGGPPPPWVERQVLAVLNGLIAHPEQLRCPPCENALPAEVVQLRQELDDQLNTPPVDEDRARELALRLAELQLNTIGPEEYETERLQRLFQSRSPMDALDQNLLHESVRRITYAGRRVTILLKNHQTMERGNNQ